ncbi:phosphatidylserine decarboxylase proenzyme 2-like isoform X1 [Carica papaya]|uniref:phosphatidylserine decarboxylase proenzyme 2-like isoform X1 n=1 Tax=Carica papaya TaxID=3649 RepID=UPI000B8C92BB|nr:phosphatidylserine decarboxylase proenzyme 2-like isoform X1 [Carica papaya]
MGHGSSRSKENGNGTPDSNGSRLSRFRRRLHLHRHQHHRLFHRRSRGHGSSSGSNLKVLDAEDFAGIAILTLIGADMKVKDKWLACVSFGEQTFRTDISDQTEMPIWNAVSILKSEPHILYVNHASKKRLAF